MWRSNPQQALTDDQMGVVCVPTPVYYTLSAVYSESGGGKDPKGEIKQPLP